jgi:hypothetical protein
VLTELRDIFLKPSYAIEIHFSNGEEYHIHYSSEGTNLAYLGNELNVARSFSEVATISLFALLPGDPDLLIHKEEIRKEIEEGPSKPDRWFSWVDTGSK